MVANYCHLRMITYRYYATYCGAQCGDYVKTAITSIYLNSYMTADVNQNETDSTVVQGPILARQ